MSSTGRELAQEHQLLRDAFRERHARVVRLDQDDASFDAEYGQMVEQAERLLEFEKGSPARLAEPQRERSERFVKWSWRAETAVAALLIAAVFVVGNTAWWLVLLVPHLLATLMGWTVEVTAARHVHQRRVAVGLHVLCVLVALVSLGVVSAWFLITVPVGWIVVGVASEDTPVKGQTR